MPNFPKDFPQINVRELQKDRVQPGMTLFNLSNHKLGVPVTAVIMDHEGGLRWWFQHGSIPDMRGDIDVRALEEGVLIGGTNINGREQPVPPILVSWKGEILWQGKRVSHHHIHRTNDGHYVFLVNDERYFRHLGMSVVSDIIVEYDPEGDSVVWEWNLFEHLKPEVPRYDWSHCNTIEPDARDGSLYLSARNLNSIFKIDRKSGDILWRLGEDGDFVMAPEDRFFHQHAPEIQPNGNLVVFDNGTGRPRENGGEFSRGIELALDEKAGQAQVVWSWRNSPDLFTPIWGDADRLADGNTLMVFGNRVPMSPWPPHATPEGVKVPTQTTRIIEVTSEGEKVWDVEIAPSQWGVYRAERLIGANGLPGQLS